MSALLNTSKLNAWYWKQYSEEVTIKAKDELIDLAVNLLNQKDNKPDNVNNQKKKQFEKLNDDDSDDDMFYRLHCEEEKETRHN